MAEFEQSDDANDDLQEAARAYLRQGFIIAALAGTSDKKSTAYKSARRNVERWTTTTASQRRKPSPASLQKVSTSKGLNIVVVADFSVGDDPAYLRKNKTMQPSTLGQQEAAEFLAHALADPNEAWQDFFEAYVIPAGTVENAQIALR